MPLAGEELTLKESLALCHVAGFDPKDLDVAVAVMCAESGRWTRAWHDNLRADGSVASTDYGLYQINTVHGDDPDRWYDPTRNAEFAFQLSKKGSDWSPWAAYNSGAHEKFVPAVTLIRQTTNWRSREKMWE